MRALRDGVALAYDEAGRGDPALVLEVPDQLHPMVDRFILTSVNQGHHGPR